MNDQPSITCPRCGRSSYHPGDIANGYCGWCHWWTSDPAGMLNRPEVMAQAEAEGAITPLPPQPRWRWSRPFWLGCALGAVVAAKFAIVVLRALTGG